MFNPLTIGDRSFGLQDATYFIADISANHDGDLERAKQLIHLAKSAGADAAKFQNFTAHKIVSKEGFESLGEQKSHQNRWKKSVFDVYRAASLPADWTPVLKEECSRAGLEYFSSPYDFDAVDMLDAFVRVYKIGSGDITWTEILRHIAAKNKPVILACGASDIGDVQRAVDEVSRVNNNIALMQCNTNYTGDRENFRFIQLNVLRTFAETYPGMTLGLSDHTSGHATVLGAVALGARIVEKHFTDDTTREGPDHPFSMTPTTWREMVDRTRELELALGSSQKRVEANERDTVVIQRRCIRASRDIAAGEQVNRAALDVLRPAPIESIPPFEIDRVLNRRSRRAIAKGQAITWFDLEP
jgi:sialic acid synthase SpsE